MSIDIDKYCKNPIEYRKTLLNSEVEYYDSICELRNSLSKKDQTIIDISTLPLTIIEGMFTPEGLKMMGLFMGVDLLTKGAYKLILNQLSKGLSKELIEEIAIKAGSEIGSLVSSSVITSVVADSIVEASTASISIAVMAMAGTFLDVVLFLQVILMLVGAVIDTWDPCGFGQELSADALEQYSSAFNEQYMLKFLDIVSNTTDSVGSVVKINIWPLEYYADSLEEFKNFNTDQNQVNYFNYTIEYLKSLTVNSNGELIVWPNVKAIDDTEFKKIIKYSSNLLSDNNTYVANFINKWWIIIIYILIIIILFIFIIR